MKLYRKVKKELSEAIVESPIIAAVKDEAGLAESLSAECRLIFILYGTVCSISTIVEKIKSKGKLLLPVRIWLKLCLE
ncbi:MAG: glycerol-3-phosphate responsive antiterminator [Catonella sp.]|uniref:glycerol-3-phosphate responsive antiterminator n=1 Tax=Catonella sp. TaxID=2382125 RepID=UPI003F9EF3C0